MLKGAVEAERAERDQDSDCARIDAAIALAEKDIAALELAGYVPARVYAGSVIEYAQRVGSEAPSIRRVSIIHDRWQDQGVSSYFQYHQ